MEEAEKAALALDSVVYTTYREARTTAKKGAGKFLKFFLIDDREREVLAATAEDQGDAHYLYKNAKGFTQHGKLESHNRKEVIMWLEKIIRESPFQVHKQEEEQMKLLPTKEHPEGLYFVSQRQERVLYPDGRKCNKFFLVDQYNEEHIAVVGEESHARDGHYHYTAHEPFASASPLSSRNATGVYHWLEQWLSHNALTAAEEEAQGAAAGQSLTDEGLRAQSRSVVLELGDWAGGEGKAVPPRMLDLSRLMGTRKRLTGAAEASHQKRMKLMHSEEAAAAEELQAAWLQERRLVAGADAEGRRSAALSSLAWLKEGPSEEEISTVEYWHSILREMVEAWEAEKLQDGDAENMELDIVPESPFSSPDGPPAPCQPNPKSRHWLRLCLEALKEVGTMYMPLKLLSQTGIMATVTKLKDHPNSSIARYSQYIALQWRTQMLAHCRALLDPAILSDPVGELEEALQNGSLAPPILGPKDRSPMAHRLKCSGAFDGGGHTPREGVDDAAQVVEGKAAGTDPVTQLATTVKSDDDCSHCEADNTTQQEQPSEIGRGAEKDASTDIADATEAEGTAAEPNDVPLEDGDDGTAVEGGDAQGDGAASVVRDQSGDEDVDCGEGAGEAPEGPGSPGADAMTGGTLPEPSDASQEEQEEDGEDQLRGRIASKELPRTGRAPEGPQTTEADAEESDLGLLLADIPEEFFPEDDEASPKGSGG